MPVDIDSYPAILIMVLGFPFLGGIFSFSDPFSDLIKADCQRASALLNVSRK